MSDELVRSISQWAPAPILVALCFFFFRSWLKSHEDKLSNVVTRLEAALTKVGGHDTALEILRDNTSRHEREIQGIKADIRDLEDEFHQLIGRVEGSGPHRIPPR